MSDMGKELICSFSSVVRSINFGEMWEVARGIFSLLNSLANLVEGRFEAQPDADREDAQTSQIQTV